MRARSRSRWTLVVVGVLAACGRIGFDPRAGGANPTTGVLRISRGGHDGGSAATVRGAARADGTGTPSSRYGDRGVRCARAP